jgi:hypothetical protein
MARGRTTLLDDSKGRTVCDLTRSGRLGALLRTVSVYQIRNNDVCGEVRRGDTHGGDTRSLANHPWHSHVPAFSPCVSACMSSFSALCVSKPPLLFVAWIPERKNTGEQRILGKV